MFKGYSINASFVFEEEFKEYSQDSSDTQVVTKWYHGTNLTLINISVSPMRI